MQNRLRFNGRNIGNCGAYVVAAVVDVQDDTNVVEFICGNSCCVFVRHQNPIFVGFQGTCFTGVGFCLDGEHVRCDRIADIQRLLVDVGGLQGNNVVVHTIIDIDGEVAAAGNTVICEGYVDRIFAIDSREGFLAQMILVGVQSTGCTVIVISNNREFVVINSGSGVNSSILIINRDRRQFLAFG